MYIFPRQECYERFLGLIKFRLLEWRTRHATPSCHGTSPARRASSGIAANEWLQNPQTGWPANSQTVHFGLPVEARLREGLSPTETSVDVAKEKN